jgi:hypothetical protein
MDENEGSADTPRIESSRYFDANIKQLINWVNERTLPEEKKARKSIVTALEVDGFVNDMRSLSGMIQGVEASAGTPDTPFVLGNPSLSAMNIIEKVLESKGFDATGGGQVTVQKTDSVTGEPVMTTVGIGEENGSRIYYGEEKNAGGGIISRAVVDIGPEKKTTLSGNGYQYRVELHYGGGRYAEQNAEINIDSRTSPRATARTLDLISNVVNQGIKE